MTGVEIAVFVVVGVIFVAGCFLNEAEMAEEEANIIEERKNYLRGIKTKNEGTKGAVESFKRVVGGENGIEETIIKIETELNTILNEITENINITDSAPWTQTINDELANISALKESFTTFYSDAEKIIGDVDRENGKIDEIIGKF